MIKIQNTPNLVGITIHGDYEDMNLLYDSLSSYLEYYYQNQYRKIDEQFTAGEVTEAQKQTMIHLLSDTHDCLSGLNYDIRHAYQGDRNVEFVENGADNVGRAAACIFEVNEAEFKEVRKKGRQGNLYFNVEILYPWALYYLFHLAEILDDWYEPDWLDHVDFNYNRYIRDRDRSMIQLFLDMLWINLKDTLGDITDSIFTYFEDCSQYCSYSYLYTEAMCHYYINAVKDVLPKEASELKKRILTIMCYELMRPYDLYEEEDAILATRFQSSRLAYENSLKIITKSTGNSMMLCDEFEINLHAYLVQHNKPFTEPVKEEYFESMFGKVEWDEIEW